MADFSAFGAWAACMQLPEHQALGVIAADCTDFQQLLHTPAHSCQSDPALPCSGWLSWRVSSCWTCRTWCSIQFLMHLPQSSICYQARWLLQHASVSTGPSPAAQPAFSGGASLLCPCTRLSCSYAACHLRA